MFTYIIQYWKWADSKHNMCWLPGRYSPTVCGVHIVYRDPQRPLLIGWKLKENTATQNHEHSNQRQQLIHVFTIVRFRDVFFLSKAVSVKLPLHQIQRFPRWKLHLLWLYNGVRSSERTRSGVPILIFVTKIHVSLIRGTEMVTWLHIAVVK